MSSSRHRAGTHRTQSFSRYSDRRPEGARSGHYATVAGRATSLAMFDFGCPHGRVRQNDGAVATGPYWSYRTQSVMAGLVTASRVYPTCGTGTCDAQLGQARVAVPSTSSF